ncbi:hypothetical protein [Nostoc sp. FACHB-280]|uniref:hypothetical protein n=1 Tax=Nostoc sp. FACHB-280 TaxID=2692839 RepID=UPI00168B7E15|nr:hypothetical protein [Nostoc sp. FACHB-280]MBD2494859.1 hypothetical protein [Nostoc sp. FACHB-280]
MSNVINCPTCGAVCRLLGQDSEGLPQIQAFSHTDVENKIEQLKKTVQHLQETLRTERANAKAQILNLETELTLSRDARRAISE